MLVVAFLLGACGCATAGSFRAVEADMRQRAGAIRIFTETLTCSNCLIYPNSGQKAGSQFSGNRSGRTSTFCGSAARMPC